MLGMLRLQTEPNMLGLDARQGKRPSQEKLQGRRSHETFQRGLTHDSRAPAEKRPEVSVGSMLRSC
jgi:hypothetical protein